MSRLGGEMLDLGEKMSMHLVFEAIQFEELLDIHELATFRQDWRDVFSSLWSLPVMKMVAKDVCKH